MNAEDLCYEPAHSLHERIVKKEISAREVVDAFLDRIDLLNPKLNAYTYLDAEGARKQADELRPGAPPKRTLRPPPRNPGLHKGPGRRRRDAPDDGVQALCRSRCAGRRGLRETPP